MLSSPEQALEFKERLKQYVARNFGEPRCHDIILLDTVPCDRSPRAMPCTPRTNRTKRMSLTGSVEKKSPEFDRRKTRSMTRKEMMSPVLKTPTKRRRTPMTPHSPPTKSCSMPTKSFSTPSKSCSTPTKGPSTPAKSPITPTKCFSTPTKSSASPMTYYSSPTKFIENSIRSPGSPLLSPGKRTSTLSFIKESLERFRSM